jgi:tRNA-dihydrouridine synthase B
MPTSIANAAAEPAAMDDCPLPSVAPLRIGPILIDPPILQAPMAGYTNYAYRQVVREFGGAGLQATEMISAKSFRYLRNVAEEPIERLWGVRDEPRPLQVQMWDNDPGLLAEVGAKLAREYDVTIVDINFGCPVRDILKAESGSYLLRDPQRVGAIVERVARACAPTPVTAKIRLGCSREQITSIEVARAVEEAGGAALTVHGRTAADFFQGSADWERIAELKAHLRNIPLIGNGDLNSPQKVLEAFRRYHVDGVMIARAALGKPWLFRQAAAALKGEPVPPDLTLAEERALLLHHYELVCRRFGEEKGTLLMRKFAVCYAQGRRGCRDFRTHAVKVATRAEFLDVVERLFPRDASA